MRWQIRRLSSAFHVEILSLPDALEHLVAYYKAVVGEHPDWADYRQAMVREQRLLIRIQIERAGPQRSV